MTDKSAIINDISKLATNVASVLLESGKNVKDNVFLHLKNTQSEMGFATKEELEVLRAVVDKQESEISALKIQVADLLKSSGSAVGSAKKSNNKISEDQLI